MNSTRRSLSRGEASNSAPRSEFAPLGHYVLADIYNRRGMAEEARREADLGRQRERAGKERTRKSVLN